jgi:hypothetical protein
VRWFDHPWTGSWAQNPLLRDGHVGMGPPLPKKRRLIGFHQWSQKRDKKREKERKR